MFLPKITSNWVGIDFLLDTGADATALFPADALFVVGIDPAVLHDPAQWHNPRILAGVAGSGACYPWPATYALQHDDGHWQTIDGRIDIVRPSPDTMPVESLLGWDVLQHFRIVIDWPGRQVTLASDPP